MIHPWMEGKIVVKATSSTLTPTLTDGLVTIQPGSYAPGCQPNCFTPNTITIGTGGEVVWKNNDNTVHTKVIV